MVLCECAKFWGWRAILGLVGLVSSCHRGYFVGPKYFFLYFMGQKFSNVDCMRKSHREQKYLNNTQTTIPNRFQ